MPCTKNAVFKGVNRTFYIETFGCQMNRNDSEVMRLSLMEKGFTPGVSPEEADILVFNTCSVRQNAEDRAAGRMGSVPGRKKKVIIAAGCMAQRKGNDLVGDGIADLALGPYSEGNIGSIVSKYLHGDIQKTTFLSQNRGDFTNRLHRGLIDLQVDMDWHRWVTITHGCENYCSYCIVPYVRGKLISFPSEQIIDQVERIAASGIIEVTLLGQNVNQYGQDSQDIPFHRLLERVSAIPGLRRVNFLTSHPMDYTEDLVKVIAENSNISRSIHLPLQSGSDAVLKKMNRNYTASGYKTMIEMTRRYIPGISFTTDIIVGYPGETEKDFNETLSMVQQLVYDDAFMYIYSPREGTPAWKLQEELSREEKVERLNRLIALQRESARKSLEKRIGTEDTCIAERVSKQSDHELMGRTHHNHPVVLPGTVTDLGKMLPIKITGINGSTLKAEPF